MRNPDDRTWRGIPFYFSEVLPKITGIFQASKSELPTSTKIVVALGNTLGDLGIMALIVPVVIIFGLISAYKSVPAFREKVDAMLWKLPLVSKKHSCPLLRDIRVSSWILEYRWFREWKAPLKL